MKILILGAGKMGTFFTDVLCLQHEVALFDTDPKRLRFVFNTLRMTKYEEIKEFEPELVINAVTLKYTLDAFNKVLPYLPKSCIISDIASVKTGLKDFYENCGFRYVSTHPMFGPTFATLDNLRTQNAIIITESDHMGKAFFKDLYSSLKLFAFHTVCIYPRLRLGDETPRRTGNYFQTPHGHCARTAVGRRFPYLGNSVQPIFGRTDKTHPRRTRQTHRHHRAERHRRHARIPQKGAEKY